MTDTNENFRNLIAYDLQTSARRELEHEDRMRDEREVSGCELSASTDAAPDLRGHTHTPGPWHTCGKDGTCECATVSCDDFPIATVTRGEWGDEFPDLRLKEPAGTMGNVVEAFVNRIPYGMVSDGTAFANARLIAAAPALLEIADAVEQELTDLERRLPDGPRFACLDELRRAIAKATGK